MATNKSDPAKTAAKPAAKTHAAKPKNDNPGGTLKIAGTPTVEKTVTHTDAHHVVQNPNGGWDVKRVGGERVSAHAETKAEALQLAKRISENQGTNLVVHGKDGKIQKQDARMFIDPNKKEEKPAAKPTEKAPAKAETPAKPAAKPAPKKK
jgi:hypothetical protein